MFEPRDQILLKDTLAVYLVNGVAEDGGLHVETLSDPEGKRIEPKDREFLYLSEDSLHHYQRVMIRSSKLGLQILHI
jgi:hypothetical protein